VIQLLTAFLNLLTELVRHDWPLWLLLWWLQQ